MTDQTPCKNGVDEQSVTIGETINHVVTYQTVTTPTVNDVYFIDGEQQPSLELLAGNTYVFDVSALPSWHPLVFSTEDFSEYPIGDIYNEGVETDTEKGTVTLSVTENTPDLHYVCLHHPNMGSVANVNTPTATKISWGDVTITLDDDTHFDINQDIEFSAINMA